MNLKSRIATLALASSLMLGAAAPALAQETAAVTDNKVTVQVTAGTLTYSIVGADLGSVGYSDTATNVPGTLAVSVDGRGNLGGWELTVQATEFGYSGESADGQAIAASNFTLTSVADPMAVRGQGIHLTHGPSAIASTASLDNAVSVIKSDAKGGSGAYSQSLGVNLQVPAFSQVGTYTSTVTLTTAAGPGGSTGE